MHCVCLFVLCVCVRSVREWLKQQKGQLNSYKRGGSLRSRPRVSYTEEEEPKDEDYFLLDTISLCLSFQ